ncbi:MAG: CDP-glycerol glycerophosphotransferase family protein [Bacillus sp. (in: firmicutes)]
MVDISMVLLVDNSNFRKLSTCLEQLQKQTCQPAIELVALDATDALPEEERSEMESLCGLSSIPIVHTIDPTELQGRYVSIYDLNYVLEEHTLQTLYDTACNGNYTFVAGQEAFHTGFATDGEPSETEVGYYAITSLKLIDKEYILTSFQKPLTATSIRELDFSLYMDQNLPYSIADCRYENKFWITQEYIERIMKEVEAVGSLLIDQEADEQIRMILLQEMTFLMHTQVFLDSIEGDDQNKLYSSVKQMLFKLGDVDFGVYHIQEYAAFFHLLKLGLFDEATKCMRLLRSEKYWKGEYERYDRFFQNHPLELSSSWSWRITKPLRMAKGLYKKAKATVYRQSIMMRASFVKLAHFRKPIWLVSEREDQAEDNGYVFFKYCRETYPDRAVYYIINRNSPHLEKVTELGNVIYHSSLKHTLYTLAADVFISAWVFEDTSYPKLKASFVKMFGEKLKKTPTITLQHGVIIHNIAPYLHKDRNGVDLFIASSSKEKEIIKETLGYNDEDIAVTGLARFDNLHDLPHPKKQVLIMPTWRRRFFNLPANAFVKTGYYQAYRGLLQSPRLQRLVEEQGYQICFYVHSQMQKYMATFVFDHPNITFLTKKDAVVSELLQESAVLITDYSSVSTDFLYMNKPVLLYQFDPENNHHFPSKQIKYSDIGIVVKDEEQLIDQLEQVIRNNCQLSPEYKRKSEEIFDHKDQKNCERIYEAIIEKTS